ncbi:hypothetical protein X739_32225 [Mesorhizobium sp. LNHC220B00]|nr:hypothetical protein X739_32225 [Mesorhizobium sp. LNHC220B00]
MTTAKPLARYSAIESALASGFATAELHHLWGRDPSERVEANEIIVKARMRHSASDLRGKPPVRR